MSFTVINRNNDSDSGSEEAKVDRTLIHSYFFSLLFIIPIFSRKNWFQFIYTCVSLSLSLSHPLNNYGAAQTWRENSRTGHQPLDIGLESFFFLVTSISTELSIHLISLLLFSPFSHHHHHSYHLFHFFRIFFFLTNLVEPVFMGSLLG